MTTKEVEIDIEVVVIGGYPGRGGYKGGHKETS
jgi:hypothetical protein